MIQDKTKSKPQKKLEKEIISKEISPSDMNFIEKSNKEDLTVKKKFYWKVKKVRFGDANSFMKLLKE